MILRNEREVQNTRRKLQRLEALYKARRDQTGGDEELRDMTMESLGGTIKQFKEEIARYQCGSQADARARPRQLRNDVELANTREKLQRLEQMYDEERAESCDDPQLRDVSKRSLKRLINQLKEEIARYEAHQPARR